MVSSSVNPDYWTRTLWYAGCRKEMRACVRVCMCMCVYVCQGEG
jgi:hypothetical protein